jgi:hypothetical protein
MLLFTFRTLSDSQVSNIASYSAVPAFESRLEYSLFWLAFVVILLNPCTKLLGYENFLKHYLQIFI